MTQLDVSELGIEFTEVMQFAMLLEDLFLDACASGSVSCSAASLMALTRVEVASARVLACFTISWALPMALGKREIPCQ